MTVAYSSRALLVEVPNISIITVQCREVFKQHGTVSHQSSKFKHEWRMLNYHAESFVMGTHS